MSRRAPAPAASSAPLKVQRVALTTAADSRLIDRAVADLRAIVVGSQIEAVIRVGSYLVEHFYGSEEEARSRRPRKEASLSALMARAEEFGMTASTLERSVRISLQARLLGHKVALELPVSHHRALLPVRDENEKRLLAEAAADGRWSYERLRTRIGKLQKPHAGGRPPEPASRVFLRGISSLIAERSVGELTSDLGELDAAERKRLLAAVERAQAYFEKLEHALQKSL